MTPKEHYQRIQAGVPIEGIQHANPFDGQEGGSHYLNLAIQPIEFCQKNKLNFCESSVIKYVVRHREKGGASDIRKAIHNLQLLLEMEYKGE